MTGTTPAPRRSGRERKPVESVYSDAKKVVAAAASAKKKAVSRGGAKSNDLIACWNMIMIVNSFSHHYSAISHCLPLNYSIHPRKRNPADEESDTSENEEDEEDDDQEGTVTASDDEEESDSEEETTEDDDDDDFEAAKPKKKKAAGSRNTKASSKKTKIQIGKSSNKSTKKTKSTTTTSKSSTAQGKINSALSTLSKHVLPPNEEPGLKSLIAGLLSSYRPPKASQVANFSSNVALNVTTPYTINLHSLAERVIEMHNDNPNKAQLALLNLLFRSVGGGPDTDLPMGGATTTATTMDENGEEVEEEETDLEHMDTEEWAEL
eukprot:scaffold5256_cov70-Skeletonema_dohrnii-CCMP3373.AAC.2